MDRKQVYQPTWRSAISDHDAFSGQTYGTIDFDVTGNRIHLLPSTDLSGGFDSFGVLISGGAGSRIMGNTISGTGTGVALHPWQAFIDSRFPYWVSGPVSGVRVSDNDLRGLTRWDPKMGQIHLGTCTGNAAPDGPYPPFDGRPTPTTGCTVDALRTDVVVDCGVGNVVRRK